MRDKIIELQQEGKSIREISEVLGISSSKCFRILHETDTETDTVSDETPTKSETVVKQIKSRCPLGLDPFTCEKHKERNSIGVIKLMVCDYNLSEQDTPYFKDMPYWDCI